jgi:hypothetical protein
VNEPAALDTAPIRFQTGEALVQWLCSQVVCSAVLVSLLMQLVDCHAVVHRFIGFTFEQVSASVNQAVARLGVIESRGKHPALQVVLIDDQLFRLAFNHSRPLDRGQLAKLIESLHLAAPEAQLIVDLDLSPLDAELLKDRQDLNRVLDRLGNKAVLLLPDDAHDESRGCEAADYANQTAACKRLLWVLERCTAQARFAVADIRHEFGVVASQHKHPFDLAAVASGYVAKAGADATPSLCDMAKVAMDLQVPALLWTQAATLAQMAEDAKSVAAVSLRHELLHTLPTAAPRNVSADCVKRSLDISRPPNGGHPSWIVLGGSWGLDDRHMLLSGTAVEPVAGAEVHAAYLVSRLVPVRPLGVMWQAR